MNKYELDQVKALIEQKGSCLGVTVCQNCVFNDNNFSCRETTVLQQAEILLKEHKLIELLKD